MGRWFILAGLVLVGIGIILQYAPWLLNWFGRLPGDIRYEEENSRIFIPITSSILISIILSILINLLRR
jgi:hypothetical protein